MTAIAEWTWSSGESLLLYTEIVHPYVAGSVFTSAGSGQCSIMAATNCLLPTPIAKRTISPKVYCGVLIHTQSNIEIASNMFALAEMHPRPSCFFTRFACVLQSVSFWASQSILMFAALLNKPWYLMSVL